MDFARRANLTRRAAGGWRLAVGASDVFQPMAGARVARRFALTHKQHNDDGKCVKRDSNTRFYATIL